ncbi:MAG: hypothetical protein ACP5I8_16800 [Phycisphaerae bacterium]
MWIRLWYLFVAFREVAPAEVARQVSRICSWCCRLPAGRYRAVISEVVNHGDPAKILREVLKLENEIIQRGEALLAKIGGSE